MVKHLQKKISGLNRIKDSVVIAIEKLQEYRSTLITQAVTGKIDVRNIKIPKTTDTGRAA